MPTFDELLSRPETGGDGTGNEVTVVNGKKFSSTPVSMNSLLSGSGNGGIQLSSSPDYIDPEYASKYDFPLYPGQDANETAALNQTPWDLAKGAMGNFAGSAAASAGGLAGFIVGVPATLMGALEGEDAPTAISNLYDNPVNKVFSDFQNYMREVVPVYKTKEMQERPWYTTLLAPEFWADEGASGLGYFAGAWASGLAAGAAVSKFMPGMIRGNVEAMKLVNGTQGATEAGLNLATKADDVGKALMNVKNFKNTNIISQFGVGMTMAAGEASAEANGVKEEITNKLKADRAAGLNKYSDEEIESEASKGGNWDFAVNLPIIAVTDMLMFTKQLSGGVKSAQLAKADKIKGMMQEVAGTAEKTGLAKLLPDMEVIARKPWLERAIRFGTGFGEEGSQEWAQYMAQAANTDYYTSREDVRARKQTLGLIGSYMDAIQDKAFDKEAILSTLLGGVMGGPTQVLTGKKARADEYAQAKVAADLVSSKNIASHLANIEGITQMMAASNQADEAILANDEMMARTFRHTALMAYVRNAEENGVGDMLVERIAQLKNVPADKLKEFFNLNDKTNFTEQDKIAYLDKMSGEVKRGRDTWRDISAKWPTLSTAIKDTIYDSIVSRDNLDNRQKKIADKINNLIMTKFPGVVPPFDFNEYMQLAAKTKSEGGEMLDDEKQTISTWKKTAKDWVGFIKNSNPEVYEEIKKDLNDLFRMSDLREVYVKNFNEALKDPEKFEYTAEKFKKMEAIINAGKTEEDLDFYNEHTSDDRVTDSVTQNEVTATGAEPNVYEGPDAENPWIKDTPTPNTQIQPKLTERKPGEKYSPEGTGVFGYTSAEFEGELKDGTKVVVSLVEGTPGVFVDEKGTSYQREDLKNLKVLRDVRKVRTDILNKVRKDVLQKTFDNNKKQLELLESDIESIQDTINQTKKDLVDIRRKKKISAKKTLAAIAELEASLQKSKELLATTIKLRDELVAQQSQLITDLNTNTELEQIGFLRSHIAALTAEIKHRNEIIENLKLQPVIIEKLIADLKRVVKGGYTALYNVYTRTYKTVPVNDQKAWNEFKAAQEAINAKELDILEEERFLEDYPPDEESRKPQIDKIETLKSDKKKLEDLFQLKYGLDAWKEAQSILAERELVGKPGFNKLYNTIPLPVKQKIEHLVEAGIIPADIARRLSEINIYESEIQDIENALNSLIENTEKLQKELNATKEFHGKIVSGIKKITQDINEKLKPKQEKEKPETKTVEVIPEVEVVVTSDNLEAFPDGWKKSIMDIFSTTNTSDSSTSEAQQRWVNTISKISVEDKYELKLVSYVKDGPFNFLFDVDNKSTELLHVTDSKGNPTIAAILYKKGKPVGKDLGVATNEELVYTVLHQPKFEHTDPKFNDKFRDAKVDGVITDKALSQMELYDEFYNKVLKKLEAGENIIVNVEGKSNGVFKDITGKRNGEDDTTQTVFSLLGSKEYEGAEIYIATDASGTGVVELPIGKRKLKLKKGFPYLKLKSGNYLPLASRKITQQEADNIYDLLKLYAETGKSQFTPDGKTVMFEQTTKTTKTKSKAKKTKVRGKNESVFIKPFKGKDGKKGVVSGYYRIWKNKEGKEIIMRNGKGIGKQDPAYYGFLLNLVKDRLEKENKKSAKSGTTEKESKTESNTDDLNSIFNYIKSVIYYDAKNTNDDTKIYNYTDEKTGVKYLVFGDKTIEFTPANLKENETLIKDFLANKIHHVKHGKLNKGKKEAFYNIEKVNSDGTLVVRKYNSYKNYLLQDNLPGGAEKVERSKPNIPLTSAVKGNIDAGLFESMYLTFDPVNIIGKVEYVEEETKKPEKSTEEDDDDLQPPDDEDDDYRPSPSEIKQGQKFKGKTAADVINAVMNTNKGAQSAEPDKLTFGDDVADVEEDYMEAFPGVAEGLNQDYEKIDLAEAKKNIERILPQVTVEEVIGKLIKDKYFGVASQAGITLSDLAAKGVEYHEAFHIVSRGILTKPQRAVIYSAAIKTWGVPTAEEIQHLHEVYPKQTENELLESFYEEKLAEAFREYMLTGDVQDIKNIESNPKAKGVFEWFFKLLEDFINYIKKIDSTENTSAENNEIIKLFKDIQKGDFAGKPVKNFGDSRFSTYTEDISAKLNQEVMSYVTMSFFNQYLKNNDLKSITKIVDNKVSGELTTLLNSVVYDTQQKLIEKKINLENELSELNSEYPDNTLDFDKSKAARRKAELIRDIAVLRKGILGLGKNEGTGKFKYAKDFKTAFDNYLRTYGFQFQEGEEESNKLVFEELVDAQESSESTKDAIALGGGKAFVEISAKSTANNAIKLFIASIPATFKAVDSITEKKGTITRKRTIPGTERIENKKGYYGLEQPVEWKSTAAFLFNELAGIYDYQKLMNKLETLTKLKPELTPFYNYFSKQTTKYYDKKLFQQAFYNTKPTHVSYLVNEAGKIYWVNSVIDNAQQKIKEKWLDNLHTDIDSNTETAIFRKDKTGKITLNKNKNGVPIITLKYEELKKFENKQTGTTNYDKLIPMYAEPLGINFSNLELTSDKGTILDKLKEMYENVPVDKINSPEELILGKEFNSAKENVSQTSRVNFLVEKEMANTVEEITHEFRGPDGELRYALHRPSFLNKMIDAINEVATRDELFRMFPHLNNMSTRFSKLFKLGGFLYDKEGVRTGNTFKSSFFSGMEISEEDYGKTTIDLTKPERLVMYLNAGFPNSTSKDKLVNYSMIWNSDKSLSNGFLMSELFTENDFNADGIIPGEVIDQFVDYLRYDFERNRILVHNGKGKDVQFYADTKGQLGVFNKLFENSPELKDQVQYFLTKNYDYKQLQNFTNSSAVRTLIAQFIDNKIAEDTALFAKYNVISKNGKNYDILGGDSNISRGKLEKKLSSFSVNSMIMNMEQLMFLTGDVNFYKKVLDIFKRVSGFAAPKHFAAMSAEDTQALIDINRVQVKRYKDGRRDDGKMPNNFINSLALNDLHIEEINSGFIRGVLEKEYKNYPDSKNVVNKLMAKSYSDMNEADGMGIMTLPEYREWKQRTGEWDDIKMQPAYEKAMGEKDEEGNYLPGKEPKLLSPDEMVYFQPQKLHVGGFLGNSEYLDPSKPENSLAVPIICKFCIFPVIPSVHEAIGAMSTEYFNRAQEMGNDSIGMFVVGPKVGAVMQEVNPGKFEMAEAYTRTEGDSAILDEDSLNDSNLMYIPYDTLGLQVKVKEKPETSGVLGVQIKKVMQGNLSDRGNVVGISMVNDSNTDIVPASKENTESAIRAINDSLTDLVIVGQNKLIQSLGLEEIEQHGEYIENPNKAKGQPKRIRKKSDRQFKVKNWKTTIEKIREHLKRSGVPNYVLDTINYEELKSSNGVVRYEALNPLDSITDRNRIESILMSMVSKTVLNPHVIGGSRIMSSILMTDNQGREIKPNGKIQSSEDLEFYREGKHGETLAAQIKIPLPTSREFQHLVIKYGGLQKLNDKIAEVLSMTERYKPENQELIKILTVISYRIPTQSLNSIDFFEIKEFLPSEVGSVVYCPSAIVAKTGADFDVDKMNFIFPSWKERVSDVEYTNSDFTDFMSEYFTNQLGKEGAKVLEKKIDKVKYRVLKGRYEDNNKDLEDHAEKYKEKYGEDYKGSGKKIIQNYDGVLGLLYFIKENPGVTPEGFTEKEAGLFEKMRIAFVQSKDVGIEFEIEGDEIYGDALPTTGLYAIKDFTIEGAAINRFIKASVKILSSPDMAGDLLNPNNTINLTTLAEQVEKAYGIQKEVTDKSKILSFSFQMDMADMFLAGKAGVGGSVLNQNNHILAQHAGLKVNKTFKVQEKNKDGKYEEVTKSSDMYFDGFKNNQDYSLGAQKDIYDENKILNIISEYTNGYVDAIKDTFIFSINAGLNTEPIHMYLLRRRVPVKTIVYFMNQPVIRDFVSQLEINKNKLLKKPLTQEKIINKLIKETLDKLTALEEDIDLSNMYLKPEDLYKAMNSKDNLSKMSKAELISYYKIQYQVINNFKDYNQQAQIAGNMVISAAIDTHKSKSLEENYVNNYISKGVLPEDRSEAADESRGNLINTESLHRLVNNSYLSIYQTVQNEIKDLFADMFIVSDENIRNVVSDILNPYLDNIYLNRKDAVAIAGKLKTELLTYIFHTYPSIPVKGEMKPIAGQGHNLIAPLRRDNTVNERSATLYADIRKLITAGRKGKDNELRYVYENNVFLKEMTTIMDDKNFKTAGLKLLNKKRLPHEQDVLIEDFMKLFEMSDVTVSTRDGVRTSVAQVANSILFTAILQSGISYSPYNFINKVPPGRYSRIITRTIEAFKQDPDKAASLSNFKEQFYRNNYKDGKLVPNVKASIWEYGVAENPRYNKYEYLKTWNPQTKDYNLYKAQEFDTELGRYFNYVEIPKLGDGILYKEYSQDKLGYSMIPANNEVNVGQDGSEKLSLNGLITPTVNTDPAKNSKSGKIQSKTESKNIKATGPAVTFKALSSADQRYLLANGTRPSEFTSMNKAEQDELLIKCRNGKK